MTPIKIKWANGEHEFLLRNAEIARLEQVTGKAIFVVYQNLVTQAASWAEVRETIYLGLVGGGMEPKDATSLIEYHVDQRPGLESLIIAQAVIAHWVDGVEEAMDSLPDTPKGDSKKKKQPKK